MWTVAQGVNWLTPPECAARRTRWTADEPATEGHDYRIELPLAVNVAFGHRRSREVAARIGQAVLAAEAARAARVRAARRAATASGEAARAASAAADRRVRDM